MADVSASDRNADSHSANMETKKAQITDRLQRREDDRLADLQRRKEEKDSTSAKNESMDFFESKFSEARTDIETNLFRSDEVPKSALTDHFDELTISCQKLQKFLSESTMFLTTHEVAKSQDVINQLQNAVQENRDRLLPKKKFAFRTKKKAVEKPEAVRINKEKEKKTVSVTLNECNFSDKSGETLTKYNEEIGNKDVALARLTDCTVKLQGSPSALHINQLKNCKILCGPVSGSIFIENCLDCTFAVACQQLRVHHTTVSHFYLHVTSRGIIEDCKQVDFAPYNWTYAELDEHYKQSGLDRNSNHWDDIDDFNWLASDTPSPNWSLLPESDRKPVD